MFRDGVELAADADGAFQLKPGNNLLGILISTDLNGELEYVDFQYFNIIAGRVEP